MIVGILALQGDFHEHEKLLKRIGVPTQQVRLPQHLDVVDRLIIPGGESTTIGRLLLLYKLFEPLRQRAGRDLPVWVTCAGAILLAQRILGGRPEQPLLGVMDMVIRRNAFGRQIESFETNVMLPAVGEVPLPGVFIRAPIIESVGASIHVLARLSDETIVAAQQGMLLATTFHPELTDDDRMHRYFLEL